MAKKTNIKREVVEIVRNYASRLERSGINVSKLILFGSQVKGKTKGHSDIDVCVVSSQLIRNDIEEAVKLKMLADEVDCRIEPHPYSPKDFAVEEDPFAHEIKRTGIEIKP